LFVLLKYIISDDANDGCIMFQNKMFVYRGKEYERLADFSSRMQILFPNAEVKTTLVDMNRVIIHPGNIREKVGVFTDQMQSFSQ
jgi:hypothetical protein